MQSTAYATGHFSRAPKAITRLMTIQAGNLWMKIRSILGFIPTNGAAST